MGSCFSAQYLFSYNCVNNELLQLGPGIAMSSVASSPSQSSGRGTVQRSNGKLTRQRLIAAAVSLMSEGGEDAVTISGAARRANITRRAAYYHFDSRNALLAGMRRSLDEQVIKATTGETDYGTPGELLAALVEQDDEIIRSRIYEAMAEGPRKSRLLKNIQQRFVEFEKEGLLQEGVDPKVGALLAASASFLGAVLTISMGRSKKERHELAQKLTGQLELFLHDGLLNTPKPSERKKKHDR